MRTTIRSKISSWIIFIIVTAGSVTMVFPFLWMLSTALKQEKLVHMFPPQWIPNPVVWKNFIDIWTISPLFNGLVNSIIISGTSVIIGTFSSSIAAFAFSKMRFPLKKTLFQVILITMMIPPVAVLIPQYIGYASLGMNDTWWPLMLPNLLGNVGMIFFLRQYMLGISSELVDSGKIDGCNYFGIYARIFLPVCKPALAANFIMWFMGLWNDFLNPLIYLISPEKHTIQIVISTLNSYYESQMNFPIIMASSLVAILPIMIVFIAFQKYFTESFALSGIKG